MIIVIKSNLWDIGKWSCPFLHSKTNSADKCEDRLQEMIDYVIGLADQSNGVNEGDIVRTKKLMVIVLWAHGAHKTITCSAYAGNSFSCAILHPDGYQNLLGALRQNS